MTLIHAVASHLGDILADPPTIPKGDDAGPPFGPQLQKVAGWLLWSATLACVVGVIITGARMAIAFRGGGDANIAQLGWVLFACILVGGASTLANIFV
jgi:hypothetical protein